jgi:hypothetical protein
MIYNILKDPFKEWMILILGSSDYRVINWEDQWIPFYWWIWFYWY